MCGVRNYWSKSGLKSTPFLTTFPTFSDVLSMVADVGTVLAVDMVNGAHTTVCRVSTGATLEIRHKQTRMTGKVLSTLAQLARPLRPRTARSWQRETVTFRYAFHVAEVLTVAALVMVDDMQTMTKPEEFCNTLNGINDTDMWPRWWPTMSIKKPRADIQQHGNPQRFSTFRGGACIIAHPAHPRQWVARWRTV